MVAAAKVCTIHFQFYQDTLVKIITFSMQFYFINFLFYLQEEQEKKRLEQLQKKAEAKALLEKEMESLKAAPKVAPPPPKITRAQIEKMKEKSMKAEPVKVVRYNNYTLILIFKP